MVQAVLQITGNAGINATTFPGSRIGYGFCTAQTSYDELTAIFPIKAYDKWGVQQIEILGVYDRVPDLVPENAVCFVLFNYLGTLGLEETGGVYPSNLTIKFSNQYISPPFVGGVGTLSQLHGRTEGGVENWTGDAIPPPVDPLNSYSQVISGTPKLWKGDGNLAYVMTDGEPNTFTLSVDDGAYFTYTNSIGDDVPIDLDNPSITAEGFTLLLTQGQQTVANISTHIMTAGFGANTDTTGHKWMQQTGTVTDSPVSVVVPQKVDGSDIIALYSNTAGQSDFALEQLAFDPWDELNTWVTVTTETENGTKVITLDDVTAFGIDQAQRAPADTGNQATAWALDNGPIVTGDFVTGEVYEFQIEWAAATTIDPRVNGGNAAQVGFGTNFASSSLNFHRMIRNRSIVNIWTDADNDTFNIELDEVAGFRFETNLSILGSFDSIEANLVGTTYSWDTTDVLISAVTETVTQDFPTTTAQLITPNFLEAPLFTFTSV